jgi:membrane protease YdiL (CAAX protease family)
MSSSPHAPDPNGFPEVPRKTGIFLGPDGVRLGWRIAIFLTVVALVFGLLFVGFLRISALQGLQPSGSITPGQALFQEILLVFATAIAALTMSRIENKSLADYGLPLANAFGSRFWQGALCGLVALSVLIASIVALHGYSFEGFALSANDALRSGLLYAIALTLTGIFEEFVFRGYLQAKIGPRIGFWPAAVLLAVLFGAVHLGNSGEAKFGALSAGCYGLVAAFTLRRTGSIWFAIGMHAAWDWGETFLYSVPISGLRTQGHLLNASAHGPVWLTGGSVGPEGSVFVLPLLLLWAVAIHFFFPARQKPDQSSLNRG